MREKTKQEEIQKAERILCESLVLLKRDIRCEVLSYDQKGYKARFSVGEKQNREVILEIPREWIEDSSPLDWIIRPELKTFLQSLKTCLVSLPQSW